MFKKQKSINIQYVKVTKITGSLFQMRLETDYGIDEMVESIKANGIQNPLMLKQVKNEYQLVSGHRRLKAAKLIGLDTVPAIVYSNILDKDAALKGMVDNLNRKELTPLEQANGYKGLMEQFGFKQGDLARALGVSQSIISEYVRTLEMLPVQVMKAVNGGRIKFAHARVLLRLGTQEEMLEYFDKIIDEELTVDELKLLLSRKKNVDALSKRQKDLERISSIFEKSAQADKSLKKVWQKEVMLKRSRIGDRLQVDFRSSKDLFSKLEKLFDILKKNQ